MQTRLPERVDPWKLAAAGGRLQGELPLAGMPRLSALLSACRGSVAVDLEGGTDEQNIRFISGHLATTAELICQRCMEPVSWPLATDFRLGLAHTDVQAASLPKEYDPLVVAADAGIALADLVEDELILALPLIPRHDDIRQCEANGFTAPQQPPLAAGDNPFAALSSLLKNPQQER